MELAPLKDASLSGVIAIVAERVFIPQQLVKRGHTSHNQTVTLHTLNNLFFGTTPAICG